MSLFQNVIRTYTANLLLVLNLWTPGLKGGKICITNILACFVMWLMAGIGSIPGPVSGLVVETRQSQAPYIELHQAHTSYGAQAGAFTQTMEALIQVPPICSSTPPKIPLTWPELRKCLKIGYSTSLGWIVAK